MKIQWLGTAGFRFESEGKGILIDPYLSRNPGARPVQELTAKALGPVSHIFISHGHFDHLMDVPTIARETGSRVVCSPCAAKTLVKNGVDRHRIDMVEKDGQGFKAGPFLARAFYSAHVRFDLRLVVKTLVRMGRRILKILPLFTAYPCGQVLSWRIEAQGKSVHFFGSAGARARELSRLRALGPVDLLLVPLQGHSHICGIGLDMVAALSPARVIPHHHDDFYPPLSRTEDIAPFLDGLARMPETRVRLPELNRPIFPWIDRA